MCSYPDSSSQTSQSLQDLQIGNHLTQTAVGQLRPASRSVVQKKSFPPVHFLDNHLCVISASVSPEIQRLTGTNLDRQEIASAFFRGFHHTIPFISKKSCYEIPMNPSMQSRADVSVLFACMRMVQKRPSGANARTPEYLALKRAFLQAELEGIVTLQLLQAWVLITFCEMGHAIYPSAYLSIGTCARYATALGLPAHESASSGIRCEEIEEKRKTWWVIVILDRYVRRHAS